MKNLITIKVLVIIAIIFNGVSGWLGCTGQIPGSIRLTQQLQTFSAQLDVNTKIDMLWVVDNSSSMDVAQEKLRNGLMTFAAKYMQPTWDIRAAVITTDTYLANPGFQAFLNTEVPGAGPPWKSPYMNSKTKPVINPIFDLSTGMFDSGVRFLDMIPVWGPDFAKLLPGLHDGPTTGLCFEGLPYFLYGAEQCAIRDDLSANVGSKNCINPAPGESSLTQCVNTVENNTVRSGKAIISTLPPAGVLGNAMKSAAWTQQLSDDFIVNVTTGSAGSGSERGLGSVLQMINDNETALSPTALFRPGSLRAIIFISDEDDQTLQIPTNPSSGFNFWTYYQCDQTSLLAMNPTTPARINGMYGYCCSDAANNCRFGAEGTSCPSKTVDGYTYTISICPSQDMLVPVSDIKAKLDAFFIALDTGVSGVSGISGGASNPNYFVVSIVAQTADAIQTLQASRFVDDAAVGLAVKTFAVDRADRYIQLGNLVGNGSLVMNIADPDYSPVLDSIGQEIVTQKSTFTLARVPTSSEDMIVQVVHADGSTTNIPSSKFTINGKSLIITDSSLVLSFASTDAISVNYQPKTLY